MKAYKLEIHSSLSKHQYSLDITSTFHQVQSTLKKQGGSANIDIGQLRKVAEMQIRDLGYKPNEMLRHKHAVVLHNSSESGSFYWWLSLALAVGRAALIRLRLNHFLKIEIGNEESFLNNVEYTVLDLMLHFDLPNSEKNAEKVENWLNDKRKVSGTVRKVSRKRKRQDEEILFKPNSLPHIVRALEDQVVGIDSAESNDQSLFSGLLLQALLGKDLEHAILLDMNQAEIGRMFLDFAEDGYILNNQKKSVCIVLQKNFKYKNAKGRFSAISNTLYKKYLAG